MSTISAGTSATTALVATGDTTGQLVIETNGATAQTIDSGQRTKFPTTIGVGNATPSASGAGITFPATQSASTDANTLDDYEEGTWTPTFRGAGTAGTYTLSGTIATYTKVGRMVCISAYFTFSAASGGSSYAVIEGMPFNIGSVSVATPYLASVDLSATNKYVTLSRVSGATNTRLYFAEIVDNGAAIDLAVSAFTTSSTVQFSLVYEAA